MPRLLVLAALLVGGLSLSACDAVGPDGAPLAVANGCPVDDPCDGSGGEDPPPTLRVNISGPNGLYMHQSELYTSSVSGGDPGYTYQWAQRMYDTQNGWSSWINGYTTPNTYASVNACGITRMQLRLRVEDSSSQFRQVKTDYHTADIINPC